jgi:limonene-1,2-epoxide hydrolase
MDWRAWATEAVDTLTMTPTSTDAAWLALFAAGGTYQDPVTGRTDDLASVYAVTRASFPDWSMTVTSARGDDTGGVIEWVSHGHLPDGPKVVLQACSVVTLTPEGRVKAWRDYFDMGEFDRQANPSAHSPEG